MSCPLPEEIEAHRDRTWRREPELRVEDVFEAEKWIDGLGFCAALTDARRPGPSLYIAVCGRRDAHIPRNVQKDPEASLTWVIKDEVMRRGNIYYAKLARGRATFVAPRLVPHLHALWGSRVQWSAPSFLYKHARSSKFCAANGKWRLLTYARNPA